MEECKIESWEKFLENSLAQFQDKYNQKSASKLKVSDFVLLKTIGVGSYGRVVLAKCVQDDKYYAMKILEKENIVRTRQVEHTLNEKRILQAIDFQFIVKMRYSFKDNCYLYIVMSFVAGGDIFSILRQVKRFDEESARFYAGQVLLGLEYLHYLGVVYRDLKPENLLIGVDGYIKMADLGFCKRIKTRTYTLCGTAEYLAPEVIRCGGYGLAVDWWCFGVLVYELCAGSSPFVSSDYGNMFKSATEGKYDAAVLQSADVRDLVRCLLQVNPSKRLGNFGNGASDVRGHPWFGNTVWLDLLNKKVKAPFRPKLSGPYDCSFFGAFEDLPLNTSTEVHLEKEFADF